MAAAGQMHLEEAGQLNVSERDAGEATRAEPTDEALVRAAQGGDRAAFGALYRRYARMVHGILLARVPRAAAEDLLQDVFLQVLPRLGSLRDARRFGGWLAAIARNRANDYHRRSRPTTEVEEGLENLPAGGRGSRNSPAEDGILLLEIVQSLPEAYREPLIMRFVEGMTGPEIAERTGMKHGSVRVNLHRGMQLLRARLEKRTANRVAESGA